MLFEVSAIRKVSPLINEFKFDIKLKKVSAILCYVCQF